MIWTFSIVFLVFILFPDLTLATQCFSCSVMTELIETNNKRMIIPSCNAFDGSAKFIIECPYSTMCLKTIHTMHLMNGEKLITTTLGCAQQKHSMHVLSGRTWVEQHTVKEIYPEGCVYEKDDKMTAKTYCYCRGNLCNDGDKIYICFELLIFLIALLIVL